MASIYIISLFILFGNSLAQQCSPVVADLGTLAPFDTTTPGFPSKSHSLPPSYTWGSLRAPLPTNNFFTNIGLNATYFPIAPYPYHVKIDDNGVIISYTEWRGATSEYIITPFIGNLVLTMSESASMTINSYDELSVNLKWTRNGGVGTMASPIVRGSPYITMEYNQMTPLFRSSHAILSVNQNTGSGPFTGTQFTIFMNNGQSWKIYSLNGTSITFTKRDNQIIADRPFTGVIRATLIIRPQDESILDASAQTYPVGAAVSYSFNNNLANIQFRWKTKGGCPERLLMSALPHQIDSMVFSNTLTRADISYSTIKGKAIAVTGQAWILQEQLTTIKWFSPSGIASDKRTDVLNALNRDKGLRCRVPDSYTAGKVLASMGRLALIADELGETATAAFIRTNMKTDIEPWLNGTNMNSLKYENLWGGLCTSWGLNDPWADYGMAWYNDHHFHFGYFIYAAAVIGKEDRTWINTYKKPILDIVRDYANPSSQDPFYPVARNKDWFDGHSWASGLFPFGDSKNQESTSESVNAYYGLYLLGESLGNTQMRDYGRLLLATEIRSVKKYWQITQQSDIYPEPFKSNKIVGVLWSTKVDHSTFFGNNLEYIHCIQMLPFTPISEEMLPAYWIREEYPVLQTALTRTRDPIAEPWKGFVYMAHAIIDKVTAWTEVNTLRYYDNGNSQTNTLYWVATRPSTTSQRINVN